MIPASLFSSSSPSSLCLLFCLIDLYPLITSFLLTTQTSPHFFQVSHWPVDRPTEDGGGALSNTSFLSSSFLYAYPEKKGRKGEEGKSRVASEKLSFLSVRGRGCLPICQRAFWKREKGEEEEKEHLEARDLPKF